jgi:hypothetical protein
MTDSQPASPEYRHPDHDKYFTVRNVHYHATGAGSTGVRKFDLWVTRSIGVPQRIIAEHKGCTDIARTYVVRKRAGTFTFASMHYYAVFGSKPGPCVLRWPRHGYIRGFDAFTDGVLDGALALKLGRESYTFEVIDRKPTELWSWNYSF